MPMFKIILLLILCLNVKPLTLPLLPLPIIFRSLGFHRLVRHLSTMCQVALARPPSPHDSFGMRTWLQRLLCKSSCCCGWKFENKCISCYVWSCLFLPIICTKTVKLHLYSSLNDIISNACSNRQLKFSRLHDPTKTDF